MGIQTYTVLYAVSVIVAGMLCHGKASAANDFRYTFVEMLLLLPIFGRVLGWW